jgi:hypothetical protein
VTKQQKTATLRRSLAKYRGGSFHTAESGGASGMMFFRDAAGREFYVGGFQQEHAIPIAAALNLTLELLDLSGGTR